MYNVLLRKPIENIVLCVLETKNEHLANFVASIMRTLLAGNEEINIHVDYDEDPNAFEEEFDG